MKVLISRKTGKYYYYKTNGDFHTKEGIIKEEDLFSSKTRVKSHTGREFLLFDASFYDNMQKITTGPQLIKPKDLGYILSRTGIGRTSFVVEAGSGSGAATSFFANIAQKVHSYDNREEHTQIAKTNTQKLGLDNIEFKTQDIAEAIENEKNIDMLFLDLPEPEAVLTKDLSGVKIGSFIVCYVPSIYQIQQITQVIMNSEHLYLEEISEIILRHWRVWDKVARPEHRKEIDHTAFLVFIRKV